MAGSDLEKLKRLPDGLEGTKAVVTNLQASVAGGSHDRSIDRSIAQQAHACS